MPSKKCEADGCTKWASFNQPGLKKPLFCRPHSHEGMVNVVSRQRCTYQNCPKQANFNHPGALLLLNTPELSHIIRLLCWSGSLMQVRKYHISFWAVDASHSPCPKLNLEWGRFVSSWSLEPREGQKQ